MLLLDIIPNLIAATLFPLFHVQVAVSVIANIELSAQTHGQIIFRE